MEGRLLRRYLTGVIPLAGLSIVVSAALFMMSAATQNSPLFEGFYSLLIVLSIVGIGLLLTLVLINIRELIGQFRAGVLGSRLTVKLVAIFVLLTFVPVSVVYVFSLQLLNRGIDSWFDIKIEQALNDALALGRTALNALQEDMLEQAQEMATTLQHRSDRDVVALNDLREYYDVSELLLLTLDGRIVAASSRHVFGETRLVPERPNEAILARVRQGGVYANVDSGERGLQLRVVVPVYRASIARGTRILQVLQPLGNRYTKLGESVQSAFAEYEKLMYLRKPLKYGFTLTLTLVALVSLLVSVWTAMFLARRFVSPIRNLAAGTRAVAEGDYRKRIPVRSQDEFGVLVKSFNDMTRRIHRAQMQIRRSQREAEAQRTYLETVLTHLSSGVLSLDARLNLRMHNAAAAQILGVDLNAHEGRVLTALSEQVPPLAPFVQALLEGFARDAENWHSEIAIAGTGGRRLLSVHATSLPGFDGTKRGARGGHVVVFDDVTNLIQAQRDAAWGEVARRLAHEIKNPLTPIQLSAERIRHKCMNDLPAPERETLDRATRTIIQQVEAMKDMVNDFADYARPRQVQLELVDLNSLVRDVMELYRHQHEGVRVELELDDRFPPIVAEPRQLRQVMHNLLLNATDALAGQAQPRLSLRTTCVRESKCQWVELQIRDNGAGFPQGILDRVFEPYVTNKEKGTGLGLAIVKKIVEEHGGTIWAENLTAGGAGITIRLPAREEAAVKERA